MKLFIFDLDGVIYKGNLLLPGVKETLLFLRKKGKKVCFLSNNSTLSRRGYIKKLKKMGLEVKEDELFPSSYLCALYFRQVEKLNQEKVMVIGEKGLYEELEKEGIKISKDPHRVRYVVVGMDRKFNFRKLSLAYQAITMGAKFIATNPDVTYPTERTTIPGAGAIVRALEACTQRRPLILGKPEKFGLEIVLKVKDSSPSQTILVGDRLETDIAVGNKLKVHTVLVLSGISTFEEAGKAKPPFKPEYVISNLKELFTLDLLSNE